MRITDLGVVPLRSNVLNYPINIVEEEKSQDKELDIRVVSDPIRLPREKVGRYACSSLGLTLLEAPEKALSSGDFVRVQHPKTYGKNQPQPRIDRKSKKEKEDGTF